MEPSLNTPIVFLIYNRPKHTQLVWQEIRRAAPKTLFIIADGPNPQKPNDAIKCAAARAVIETLDWNCVLQKNYSDINLNCGKRPASGLDWVFEQVEEAIVLEDDCLPHPTFFRYCQELLEYYRHDSRIMTISGNNFQYGKRRTADSYFFSRYPLTCGWATWRRVWELYDYHLVHWPEIHSDKWLYDVFANLCCTIKENREVFSVQGCEHIVRFWSHIFSATYTGHFDWWDYQMLFTSLLQHGLNIIPNVNLITNIGYGSGATHTTQPNIFADIPSLPMEFPLIHPSFMIRDAAADAFLQAIRYPSYIDKEFSAPRYQAIIKETEEDTV